MTTQQYPEGHPERAVFCSRTLNLRAIQAIGRELLLRELRHSMTGSLVPTLLSSRECLQAMTWTTH